MAVSVNKVEGVTVYTVASDPRNPYPLLCQILCGLCCNPLCCVVSETLRKIQGGSQYLLGTLHIVVGILNISLGVNLITWSSPYPFWLGGMFIFFGIVAILSEKYPSSCVIILNVVLNLFGILFAIAAIVLYSIDLAISDLDLCDTLDEDQYYYSEYKAWSKHYREKCLNMKQELLMMAKRTMILLIVLAVLELCVTISCAVMGIKALKNSEKIRNEEAFEKSEKSPHRLNIVED